MGPTVNRIRAERVVSWNLPRTPPTAAEVSESEPERDEAPNETSPGASSLRSLRRSLASRKGMKRQTKLWHVVFVLGQSGVFDAAVEYSELVSLRSPSQNTSSHLVASLLIRSSFAPHPAAMGCGAEEEASQPPPSPLLIVVVKIVGIQL